MAAAKGKSVARTKGKQMSAEQAKKQLQDQAANIKDRIGAPESNNISIKDKIFTFPDGHVVQDSIEVVIIDFMAWNQYYNQAFDPKNPAPPVCFAFAENPRNLAPHEASPEPQADTCAQCWANEFGSGTGDGKACKNQRKLAVIPAGEDPLEGPMYTITVPPTSIKKFDGYVNTVARLYNVPPIGVKTTIRIHPESVHVALLFDNPEPNPELGAHMDRQDEARDLLQTVPDTSGYEPPKKSAGKGRAKRK